MMSIKLKIKDIETIFYDTMYEQIHLHLNASMQLNLFKIKIKSTIFDTMR